MQMGLCVCNFYVLSIRKGSLNKPASVVRYTSGCTLPVASPPPNQLSPIRPSRSAARFPSASTARSPFFIRLRSPDDGSRFSYTFDKFTQTAFSKPDLSWVTSRVLSQVNPRRKSVFLPFKEHHHHHRVHISSGRKHLSTSPCVRKVPLLLGT